MMVSPATGTASPDSGEYRLDDDEDHELSDDTAVQDGGAASFLGSRKKITEYVRFLVEHGVDPSDVEVYRCHKGFKYGNSQSEVTDMCVLMPLFVAGRKLKALCYVIGGNAPILMGRPMLERLGLAVTTRTR